MQQRRLLILIVLAAAVLLGLILFVSMRPSQLFRIAAPAPQPVSDLASIKTAVSATSLNQVSATTLLEKPRYTGQDNLGHNWTVTANSAGQEGSSTSATYVLNGVQAVWTDPSATAPKGTTPTPLTLSATQGRYAQTSQTLLLKGDVSATGIGFNLTAPQVEADLATRTLQTSGGSTVRGTTAGWNVNITAPKIRANQTSQTLLLTGGVRATFTPTKK